MNNKVHNTIQGLVSKLRLMGAKILKQNEFGVLEYNSSSDITSLWICNEDGIYKALSHEGLGDGDGDYGFIFLKNFILVISNPLRTTTSAPRKHTTKGKTSGPNNTTPYQTDGVYTCTGELVDFEGSRIIGMNLMSDIGSQLLTTRNTLIEDEILKDRPDIYNTTTLTIVTEAVTCLVNKHGDKLVFHARAGEPSDEIRIGYGLNYALIILRDSNNEELLDDTTYTVGYIRTSLMFNGSNGRKQDIEFIRLNLYPLYKVSPRLNIVKQLDTLDKLLDKLYYSTEYNSWVNGLRNSQLGGSTRSWDKFSVMSGSVKKLPILHSREQINKPSISYNYANAILYKASLEVEEIGVMSKDAFWSKDTSVSKYISLFK